MCQCLEIGFGTVSGVISHQVHHFHQDCTKQSALFHTADVSTKLLFLNTSVNGTENDHAEPVARESNVVDIAYDTNEMVDVLKVLAAKYRDDNDTVGTDHITPAIRLTTDDRAHHTHKEDKEMDSGDLSQVSIEIKCNNPVIVSEEKNRGLFPSANKDIDESKLVDKAREAENVKVTDEDKYTSTLDVDGKQSESRLTAKNKTTRNKIRSKYFCPFNLNKNVPFQSNKKKSFESGWTVPSISAGCPHILPLLGDQVVGAPKINPQLGKVVSDPRNVNRKFIRYFIFYIRILSYDISCRTIGAATCNICNKMNGCEMIYDSDKKNSQQ